MWDLKPGLSGSEPAEVTPLFVQIFDSDYFDID